MIAYLVFRFLLDFIKPHYPYFSGLGAIQLCCLIGLLYYAKTIREILFNFSAIKEHGK